MTIFYSDMETLSQYSPVKLHLSHATRFLSENPGLVWQHYDNIDQMDPFLYRTEVHLSCYCNYHTTFLIAVIAETIEVWLSPYNLQSLNLFSSVIFVIKPRKEQTFNYSYLEWVTLESSKNW